MVAELFAIASAMSFAVSAVIIRLSLQKHASPFAGVLTFLSGSAFLWAIVLFKGYPLPSLTAATLFILRGILDPGLAALFIFFAFRKIGVTFTVPIIAASALVSTTLSVLFLDEVLSWTIITGTLLILFGVVCVSARHLGISSLKQAARSSAHLTPNPDLNHNSLHKNRRLSVFYLAMAVVGSVLIGVAAVLTKAALDMGTGSAASPALPVSPVSGVALSFLAGLSIQLFLIGTLRKWDELPRTMSGAAPFFVGGIFGAMGFLLNFLALQGSSVSIIGPLLGTQPLFAIFLSYIFLRKHESVTWATIAGSVLIVVGAALLI